MAFATNASRFSFLTDDAPDPFVTKKKSNKNKTPAGTAAATSKPNSAAATAQGKKNKKKASTSNSTLNVSAKNGASNPDPGASGSGKQFQANPAQNSKAVNKEPQHDKAWIEWEKRDKEFVTGSYEMDLEQALAQSKLDFQKEQTRLLAGANAKGAKSKKKVPIPLAEFNGMGDIGNGMGSIGVPLIAQDDDVLMQQFRLETQLEVERERQLEAQRALIQSRNAVFAGGSTPSSSHPRPSHEPFIVDDKDATIAQLTLEKQHIEKEYELLRNRFKKLCSLLSDAELKEKLILVRDIENMTKVNQDLNEQINGLCSELEQEKSRSHAAITELRKVHEQNRRRGQSQSDNF